MSTPKKPRAPRKTPGSMDQPRPRALPPTRPGPGRGRGVGQPVPPTTKAKAGRGAKGIRKGKRKAPARYGHPDAGVTLKGARTEHVPRLSQAKLATAVGVRPVVVCQYECRVRRPSAEVLVKMAALFQLPASEAWRWVVLWYGTEPKAGVEPV